MQGRRRALRCTAAPALADLQSCLAAEGSPDSSSWVVTDLSLGGWRGRQAATECCLQLGMAPPGRSWPELMRSGPGRSFADLVGHGIDAESQGEVTALTALQAVSRLAARLSASPPRALVVLAPRAGLPWEPEDLLFVQLLWSGLAGAAPLVVGYADPPAPDDPLIATLPTEWSARSWPASRPVPPAEPLALVPGIVAPAVADALGGIPDPDGGAPCTARLGAGFLLVAPEARPDPRDVPRLEHDRLAAAPATPGWLRAYAQYRGNNVFVDSPFLLAQAWERFAEGGGGIGLRLLDRAEQCADDPQTRAVAQTQAQGMRIALGRFSDVAAAPSPSPAAPSELRGFLTMARAYGLVMTDRAEEAEEALAEAHRLLEHQTDGRELLYLLNITALARLKRGDAHGALALEHEMAVRSTALPRPDWRLRYVNLVNIARVLRRLGRLEESRTAYADAFAVTLGSRSEGEALYTNLCLARLDAERGDAEAALLGWLRAALHWAAAAVPEALTRRIAAAVTGGGVRSPLALDEQVSDALLTQLAAAARACGIPGSERLDRYEGGPTPAFAYAGTAAAAALPAPHSAVAAPGWCVLPVAAADCAVAAARPASRALRAGVVALLSAATDAPELIEADAVLVDDRLGQEMAQTPCEVLETALRLDVPRVLYQDRPPLLLDADLRARLHRSLRIEPGAAVETLTRCDAGQVARFRRGGTDRVLPDDIAAVLDPTVGRRTVGDLIPQTPAAGPDGELVARLRALEAERVLYLTCSEETCAAAGTSWPSRASSPVTSAR